MQRVQLAIDDAGYRAALAQALSEAGSWQVVSVPDPDPGADGVIVVDAGALDRVQGLLGKPERVVLITHKDAQHLARAWEAGVISVVFEDDPIGTAMLAIMSAALRVPQDESTVLPPEPPVRRTASPCRCESRRAARETN